MKKIIPILVIILFASCSFNREFLRPTKILKTARKARLIDFETKDTVLIQFSGNSFQPTFTNSAHLVNKKPYTIESILFKNDSNIGLNGWMIKPTDKLNIETTILHLHGNEGSILNQYAAIAPLVGKGIQVFTFDYSGFGFSDGEASRKTIVSDAVAALKYILTREDVKRTKIIVYGQSLGGYFGAIIAAQNQNLIDGLVVEGGFSSPRDIGAYTLKKSIEIGFLARLITKPGVSAYNEIKKYHKPLLIIHSSEDKEVPFYMGKKVFEDANSPKKFYEIKGSHINGPRLYPDSISSMIKTMANHKPKNVSDGL